MSQSIDRSRNNTIHGNVTVNGDNAFNLGDISSTVNNTIGQLPSSDSERPGIKELLEQLQAAIEADTHLEEEDKAEALEQVEALAIAGGKPKDGATKKAAKTAMKILKGTAASLPTAAKLVEACNKLLPTISSIFGLV